MRAASEPSVIQLFLLRDHHRRYFGSAFNLLLHDYIVATGLKQVSNTLHNLTLPVTSNLLQFLSPLTAVKMTWPFPAVWLIEYLYTFICINPSLGWQTETDRPRYPGLVNHVVNLAPYTRSAFLVPYCNRGAKHLDNIRLTNQNHYFILSKSLPLDQSGFGARPS